MSRRPASKEFGRDLYQEIRGDKVFNGAAMLGFYLTLAIFPALILIMIILMMWLYIAGLAILIGAEINVLIDRHKAKEPA